MDADVVNSALALVRTIKSWTPEAEFNAIVVGYGDVDKLVLLVEAAAFAGDKVRWFHSLAGDTDAARALTLSINSIKELQQLSESLEERRNAVADQTKLDSTCVMAAANQVASISKTVAAAVSENCIHLFKENKFGIDDFKDIILGVAGGKSWCEGCEDTTALKALIEVFDSKLKPHFDVDSAHGVIEKAWKHVDHIEAVSAILPHMDLPAVYAEIAVELVNLKDLSRTTLEYILLAGVQKMAKTNRPALKRFITKQDTFLKAHKSLIVHATIRDTIHNILTTQKQIL
jgi:hypothetical protein